MTAKELRAIEARYQRASRIAEQNREARNAAIQAALAEGWTHQQIADATGLTRGRISQIREQPATSTRDNPCLMENDYGHDSC